jgi:DNA-binding PadR family transcriptional regulator
MSLKYMILGGLKESPAHGYAMVDLIYRDFCDQKPEINSGQLYALLAKMESEGLIERNVIHQDKAPSRKVISITRRGEEEFDAWLGSDAEEMEYTRYDFFSKYGFLYKVNHFSKLEMDEVLGKVDQQIGRTEETLDNFYGAEQDMTERGVDPFRILILQYGIEVQKTKLDWLKRLRQAVLQQKPGGLDPKTSNEG